mgnify:FL=1
MDRRIEIYKTWAPDNSVWTAWAKPVLFADLPKTGEMLEIPQAKWIGNAVDTMVIVDLPGIESVVESLALAKEGYRPVPLYNGVKGPSIGSEIVAVGKIQKALIAGADILSSLYISPSAPPVFMLDSKRFSAQVYQAGKYDNRWCVFPQDMPSAKFLKERNIKHVVVRSTTIRNDLSHILCRYQEQGISIYLSTKFETQKVMKVKRPSEFKSLFYRISVMSGLRRNSAGGFGGMIPDTETSGTGRRYYGIG